MAKQRSSFAKLQRDKAKKERAAMKRANRRERRDEADSPDSENQASVVVEDGTAVITGEGELSASELLTLIEDLHNRREAGSISQEDFEEAKVELFARLPVD